MEGAFPYVAHGGELILVGVISDKIAFSDPEFHKREMTLKSTRNALRSDFEHVMAAVCEGKVPLDRLITHRTTLAGAIRDLGRWTTDKRGLVKALIEVG
jgi:threonine dehydrogenase-like Zn-dependent dehydrogenase